MSKASICSLLYDFPRKESDNPQKKGKNKFVCGLPDETNKQTKTNKKA